MYTAFKNGFHGIQPSDRFWAGLSSDLVIESVLMRSLKAIGRLTEEGECQLHNDLSGYFQCQ